MPIKPPRLDDRSYEDLVREARALIPQYTPEWTHLGDSDPGMTLVQLFAWMTEMTLYRLNRVPDKTYVHFLNFIGEERRGAAPATAPITFTLRNEARGVVDVPANTRCSTRQKSGGDALHFLTEGAVSVHGARVERVVSVVSGAQPMVREIPFNTPPDRPQVVQLAGGQGVPLFQLDPVLDGPYSYTADQMVYLRHEDFFGMGDPEKMEGPGGVLRVRSAGEVGLPVVALFDWEYPAGEEGAWLPVVKVGEGGTDTMGVPDPHLRAVMPGLAALDHLGSEDDPIAWPEELPTAGWIRGKLRYERWLAQIIERDLRITWRDDRGGEERELTTWFVRDVGRTLELFVRNLPPLRAGWALRLTLVDHGMPAGRQGYFPRYRWSYRRGQRWVPIPDHAVEMVGAGWVITGPLIDMASDGFNLRAERIESVNLLGLLPDLKVDLTWRRPVTVHLASGPETVAAVPFPREAMPREPFQAMPSLPALLGMKLFIGSDLLLNRAGAALLIELEMGFEREGEPVAEPVDDYHLQLCYRTAAGWQVLSSAQADLSSFRLADLDPDGAKLAERRLIRLRVDPTSELRELVRETVAGQRTGWLRLELTRAALTWQKDNKTPPVPVSLRLYDVTVGLERAPAAVEYDEPLPGGRLIAVEHRPHNRRFTRVQRRHEQRLLEELPFDGLIAVEDPSPSPHRALYLRLDRPLPVAKRLTTTFLCRGETFLPEGFTVSWEALAAGPSGEPRWMRLYGAEGRGEGGYRLDRSGALELAVEAPIEPSADGVWLRGILRRADEGPFPGLPPVTHVLLNTVPGRNLHGFRMEKFSGEGVPHQVVQLRHFPVWLPDTTDTTRDARDRFAELKIVVDEQDGDRRPWRVAPGNSFAQATKDDRVFVVDPVEGTLTFGNGLRGRILPIGSFNLTVESYHTVPGAAGNVAAGEIVIPEGFADLVDVINVLPGHGGRNAESIDEIIRRAPSILTSRDRAVTRRDFEIIAKEASAEVARAACLGGVGADGGIEVVILPQRRGEEELPDPFLAAGLRQHVQTWLARRCLVNVQPKVRLATFLGVDISLDLRLRSHANPVSVRDAVVGWVRRFLDPYVGGLDGEGWPFGATLYAQDLARVVADVPEVRHVVEVRLFPHDALVGPGRAPGWEVSPGVNVLSLADADLLRLGEVRVRLGEDRG